MSIVKKVNAKAERLKAYQSFLGYVVIVRRSVLVSLVALYALNTLFYGRDVSLYALSVVERNDACYWIAGLFVFVFFAVPSFVIVMLNLSINIDRRIEELERSNDKGR